MPGEVTGLPPSAPVLSGGSRIADRSSPRHSHPSTPHCKCHHPHTYIMKPYPLSPLPEAVPVRADSHMPPRSLARARYPRFSSRTLSSQTSLQPVIPEAEPLGEAIGNPAAHASPGVGSRMRAEARSGMTGHRPDRNLIRDGAPPSPPGRAACQSPPLRARQKPFRERGRSRHRHTLRPPQEPHRAAPTLTTYFFGALPGRGGSDLM